MRSELPCCQGIPEHTFTDDCLLRHNEVCDLDSEEGRKAIMRKIEEGLYDNGGLLHPGVSRIRLAPDEQVLTQEDVRRLQGGEQP